MPGARETVARGLAAAFLAGPWEPVAMTRRGQKAVGQRRVWVRDLALAAVDAWPTPPSDRPRDLATFLASCPPLGASFKAAWQESEAAPKVVHWYFVPTEMGEPRWHVPLLDTTRDLRQWLGLSVGELRWFADPRQLERSVNDERLRQYRYRWIPKKSGGVRLLEAPKLRLKRIQRMVLHQILDRVPPHSAAHGFRPGRSALTYAAGHTAQALVIHLDLEDFFASIVAGRAYGIFRQCGYPEPVAHLLTSLVTNSVPHRVWANAPLPPTELLPAHRRLGERLAHAHLPQGAPTSPSLANLAAYRLDRRLAGLSAAAGFAYSRYADDLALSSTARPSSNTVDRLAGTVHRIVGEEGFRVSTAKTAVMPAGQRQRLAGIVVNQHPNIDRRDFDRLKATLHNAHRYGPTSQNHRGHPDFRAHLLGRIAWIRHLNPDRGDRLLALYERIEWGAPDPATAAEFDRDVG
jgi:RNA-directed DNA polymerase